LIPSECYFLSDVVNSVSGTRAGDLIFIGKTLGRPRRRWVGNIQMDVLEIGWGGVDWIGLAQDRDKWRALVNAVMNLRVP
jgi:hypothetical protein